MKNLIIGVFSVFVLFNLSCTHDKCCTPPQPSAHMTAEKNDTYWNTFYVISKRSDIGYLSIYAISGEITPGIYVKADSLNFKILYTGEASYALNSNQVSYATFAAGATKSYKLDTTYNNVLSITGYETLHNAATTNPDPIKITGTFDLKFIDPNNPAGIIFSNGNFYTNVSN